MSNDTQDDLPIAVQSGLTPFESKFTLREKVSIVGAITSFAAWAMLVFWPIPSYLYAIPMLLLMSGLLMFARFQTTPCDKQSVKIIDSVLNILVVFYMLWSLFAWDYNGVHGMGISRAIPVLTGWLFLFAGTNIGHLSYRFGKKIPTAILSGITCIGVICAVYAIMQYCWLYDVLLKKYLAELPVGMPLDSIQEGIIHHLRLRRVAATLGDPNILGTMLAIGVIAGTELTRNTYKGFLHAIGWIGVFLCMIALPLTGSRGAIVALFLAMICSFLGMLYPRYTFIKFDLLTGTHQYETIKPNYRYIGVVSIFVLFAIICGFSAQKVLDKVFVHQENSNQVTNVQTNPDAGLLTRISTIKERKNYLTIGKSIFDNYKWIGGGFGIVERDYGKHRPVNAQETKYLHNLALQLLCEIGIIGNTVFFLAVILLFIRICLVGLPRPSPWFAIFIILLLLLFDSLWSVSATNIVLNATYCLLLGMLLRSLPDKDKVDHSEEIVVTKSSMSQHLAAVVIIAVSFYIVNALSAYEYRKEWIREELRLGHPDMAENLHRGLVKPWFVKDGTYSAILSDILLRERKLGDSVQAMQEAVEEQPDSASLNARLAELLVLEGKNDQALWHAKKAVALYPHSAEHRNTLSQVYEKNGDIHHASIQANYAADFASVHKDEYVARAQALQNKLELSKQDETIGLP